MFVRGAFRAFVPHSSLIVSEEPMTKDPASDLDAGVSLEEAEEIRTERPGLMRSAVP